MTLASYPTLIKTVFLILFVILAYIAVKYFSSKTIKHKNMLMNHKKLLCLPKLHTGCKMIIINEGHSYFYLSLEQLFIFKFSDSLCLIITKK